MRSYLRILFLLAVGLVVGAGVGLYAAWFVWPVSFSGSDPSLLQESYQQDYIRMVADAYAVEGDLPVARQRLARFGADGGQVLLDVVLDMILRGDGAERIRPLAQLAADLDIESPALTRFLTPDTGASDAP